MSVDSEATVGVVGGGPAGLSAALFTAKNGLDTTVYDAGETALHYAHLFNYPGIESMDGSEFVEVARGQVTDQGADLVEQEVTAVEAAGEGFVVETGGGDGGEHDYVVFATGQSRQLAAELGCEQDEDATISVDADQRTSVEGAYAAGWAVRKDKIQAAISVGGGAAAGLDILSAEAGEPFHDFDTPEDAE